MSCLVADPPHALWNMFFDHALSYCTFSCCSLGTSQHSRFVTSTCLMMILASLHNHSTLYRNFLGAVSAKHGDTAIVLCISIPRATSIVDGKLRLPLLFSLPPWRTNCQIMGTGLTLGSCSARRLVPPSPKFNLLEPSVTRRRRRGSAGKRTSFRKPSHNSSNSASSPLTLEIMQTGGCSKLSRRF